MSQPSQSHLLDLLVTRLATSAPFSPNFSRKRNATFSKTLSESNNAAPLKSMANRLRTSLRALPRNRLISASPTRLSAVRLQQADHMLQQHALSLTALADDGRQFSGRGRKIEALQYRLSAQRFPLRRV